MKISFHRSHLFQQKIRYVFDLIICQLIDLDNKYQRIIQRICTSLVVKMCLFYIFILFS